MCRALRIPWRCPLEIEIYEVLHLVGELQVLHLVKTMTRPSCVTLEMTALLIIYFHVGIGRNFFGTPAHKDLVTA